MRRNEPLLNSVQRQRRGPRWAQAQDGVRPGFRPHVRREARVPRPPAPRQSEYLTPESVMMGNGSVITFAWTDGYGYSSFIGSNYNQANKQAKDLLLSLLDEEQREHLERYEQFHITAPGGNRYRITTGRVYRLNDEEMAIMSYCLIVTAPYLPMYDQMLAKMLLIQADEEQFLRRANPIPIIMLGEVLARWHPDRCPITLQTREECTP